MTAQAGSERDVPLVDEVESADELPLAPGDVAVDREAGDENSNGVVVLNRPTDTTGAPIAAGEYVVVTEPDGTEWTVVPRYNDPADYSQQEPVVEAVYASSLNAVLDGPWSIEGVLTLYENDAFERSVADGGLDTKCYAFPLGRLLP